MYSVKVKKSELLEKIKSNHLTHKQAYEEAFEGYKKTMQNILEIQLDLVKKGAVIRVEVFSIPVPQDHSADYERAVMMLEMSVADKLDVSEEDFRMYVMDDWGWKRAFADTYTVYTSKSL